jgi:hypothetical protein
MFCPLEALSAGRHEDLRNYFPLAGSTNVQIVRLVWIDAERR